MRVLAIVGSYRKGKTIDTLIDKAIEGARAGAAGDVHVDKITLIDKNIKYCTNCMACERDDPAKPRAHCVINDDMAEIYPLIESADAFIVGTPVNMGAVTAVTKTFLERICWVYSKPGNYPIKGCPTPRDAQRKRRLITIVSSGVVPSFFRRFCDDATPLIKYTFRDALNTAMVGSLYAGNVRAHGSASYYDKAYALGRKLTKGMA